jgi:hypothetical protein
VRIVSAESAHTRRAELEELRRTVLQLEKEIAETDSTISTTRAAIKKAKKRRRKKKRTAKRKKPLSVTEQHAAALNPPPTRERLRQHLSVVQLSAGIVVATLLVTAYLAWDWHQFLKTVPELRIDP